MLTPSKGPGFKRGWLDAAQIVRSWQFQTGMRAERVAVLSAVWEKEMGHMARHWKLKGVRRGILYVVPRSPAAGLELRMRGPGIVKMLNKHFSSDWIKGIKAAGH